MVRIKSLPQEVVEKIAAGEVVERPASIVKELIENAIDAQAGSVSVDIAVGGCERITVIDDGVGMENDDLRVSIERHATSKITSADDLWNISTMGFRGEALAAVAAVSRLVIESKPNERDVIEGGRIVVEGGKIEGPVVAGCAGGTRVEVSDLFFNVPARRKFLKSANVEAGHVSDIVSSYALAYPSMRFELSVDGNKRIALAASKPDIGGVCSTARAKEVFGGRIGNPIAVEEGSPDISVRGVVAEGGRRAGKDVHFFLNGRPVKDRMLMHALTQAFGERFHAGAYPAAVLWIDLDPIKVDVNVHPAKREVRFSDGGAVYSFLMSAIKKNLSQVQVSVSAEAPRAADAAVGVEAALLRFEEKRASAAQYESNSYGASSRGRAHFAPRQADAAAQIESEQRGLNPIGQYALSYIVCEDADGSLVLIDQHAAHERLGFEGLKASYSKGSVPQQRLLIPEQIELGEKSAAYIVDHIERLMDAGFEVEPFGGGTLLVKAVPELVGDSSVSALMERLADQFEDMGDAVSLGEIIDKVFAVVACHRQVRAGDRLGARELSALIADIEREGVTTCPHGRPAMVRISKDEVEKWFKRK